MPSIVQFAHPGSEHSPDSKKGNWKSWNTEPHKRKFLQCDGSYIDTDGTKKTGNLQFWGEWEPPSKVIELKNRPNDLFPRWIHQSILPDIIPNPDESHDRLQNTDPFVFEKRFIYFVCKQHRRSGITTSLTKLDKGSLILFGSTHGKTKTDAHFQLDTVYVVGDFIDYDASDSEAFSDMPELETYRQIVYKKAFPIPSPQRLRLRLYFGATPDDPISGMYSYSPAKVSDDIAYGFPRVALRDMPFLTNNLNASPRSSQVTQPEIIEFWESVRKMTRQAGLVEGFGFKYQIESSIRTDNKKTY